MLIPIVVGGVGHLPDLRVKLWHLDETDSEWRPRKKASILVIYIYDVAESALPSRMANQPFMDGAQKKLPSVIIVWSCWPRLIIDDGSDGVFPIVE
jgi:hypothetical protein